MMFEISIISGKTRLSLPKIEPNPFLIAYFEMKTGIIKPKKVINLTLGDLYALAGFSYSFIYNYREIQFRAIETYDRIYQEADRKKYKDLAGACLRLAYSLIQKLPRGAKVSFKAV